MASENKNDIRYMKGVGEKRAHLLQKLGIDSVDALLRFYPRDYLDLSVITPLDEAVANENRCYRCTVKTPIKEVHFSHSGTTVFRFTVNDTSGECDVTLYNTRFLAKSLHVGESYLFYGKAVPNLISAEIVSPIIRPVCEQKILPVYPLTAGISSTQIAKLVAKAMECDLPEDPLPPLIRKEYRLCSLADGLRMIHFPANRAELDSARKRFVFEELFLLQAAFSLIKKRNSSFDGYRLETDATEDFFSCLPFSPTDAQRRVIKECMDDMTSGRMMNRLIEGDVGSGKTVVAAALCHSVVKNGFQCAVMAPTEILAGQHFKTFSRFFANTGIVCEQLTGSMTKKDKVALNERLKNGEIDILIGTHALISTAVTFRCLGLAVTDEQHRFGVAQRGALANKGTNPHRLVLSATPIPRTLALIIYGELDISILDAIPGNRPKIQTFSVNKSYRPRYFHFIREQIAMGRQCYIVCPAIEENEDASELVSVEEYYRTVTEDVFRDLRVGLLHGKMNATEKSDVMKRFVHGEIDILVSTTVIEVGIDVPNATVMVIENAERFGLSQLHQLRGRIGRGKEQSYCIAVSESNNNPRLAVFCKTTDGFRLADEDLTLRGPGDFIGQRQHGLPMLKIANLSRDIDVFHAASRASDKLFTADPTLSQEKNAALKRAIITVLHDTETN